MEHEGIHPDENPFSCTNCDQEFANEVSLKNHERIHTDQNHSVATIVAQNSQLQVRLKKHERIHTDENLFSCKNCDKKN